MKEIEFSYRTPSSSYNVTMPYDPEISSMLHSFGSIIRSAMNMTTNFYEDEFKKELEHYIITDYPEVGINTKADIFLEKYLPKYTEKVIDCLIKIYYEHTDNPKMIIGVLTTLRRNFKFHEIYKLVTPILEETMLYNDAEVVEHTIRVLEDWHNTNALTLLCKMPKLNKWLEEYKQKIISEIEKYKIKK